MAGHPPFEPLASGSVSSVRGRVLKKIGVARSAHPMQIYQKALGLVVLCLLCVVSHLVDLIHGASKVNKGITKVNFPNKMKGVVEEPQLRGKSRLTVPLFFLEI